MLTDGKILELFDATGGGIVGRLSRFARAIEAEVLQTQEPAGEIIMYAPCGKLSAPFARPEWHGGALPPVGTKLYTAPLPPAKCQISTDTEYYRAECEKLQAKVAELEQFKQMWAISCAERDALQAKVAILDGLSQVAIDGGWTYRGMEAYANGLEAKVAELEKAYKDKNDAATQLVAAMRDMAGKVKEQSAEIERLNRGMTVYTEAFEAECRTTDEQNMPIEMCEQALKNEHALQRGYQYRGGVPIRSTADEAIAAIAAHRGQYSELAAQCSESRPQCSELEKDAARYRWLRSRDLDSIVYGGVFAGMVPDNVVLNGDDLDAAIDAAIAKDAP